MQQQHKRHKQQIGFTLIELLVVLVILGLLAGMVAPKLLGKTERAKSKAAVTQVQILANAVTEYYLETGNLPEQLAALAPKFIKGSQIKDPWGIDYHYENPGQHEEFDIYSLGADNSPGGEDENRDINSWE